MSETFFPAKVNLVQVAHGSCALLILGDIPGHGPGTPALVALTEQDVGPVGHESSLSGCFCLSVTVECCLWPELELPHQQIYPHI